MWSPFHIHFSTFWFANPSINLHRLSSASYDNKTIFCWVLHYIICKLYYLNYFLIHIIALFFIDNILCLSPHSDCKFNCHKRCAYKVPNDCLGEATGGNKTLQHIGSSWWLHTVEMSADLNEEQQYSDATLVWMPCLFSFSLRDQCGHLLLHLLWFHISQSLLATYTILLNRCMELTNINLTFHKYDKPVIGSGSVRLSEHYPEINQLFWLVSIWQYRHEELCLEDPIKTTTLS